MSSQDSIEVLASMDVSSDKPQQEDVIKKLVADVAELTDAHDKRNPVACIWVTCQVTAFGDYRIKSGASNFRDVTYKSLGLDTVEDAHRVLAIISKLELINQHGSALDSTRNGIQAGNVVLKTAVESLKGVLLNDDYLPNSLLKIHESDSNVSIVITINYHCKLEPTVEE